MGISGGCRKQQSLGTTAVSQAELAVTVPAASSVSPSALSRHEHPGKPCQAMHSCNTQPLLGLRGTHSHRAELLLASLVQHFTPSCSTSHSSAGLDSISAATPVLRSPHFGSHPGTAAEEEQPPKEDRITKSALL